MKQLGHLQKYPGNATFGARRSLGMTLIELIIAMVVISVGLAGVAAVFTATVKSSADPMIQKQMLAIAEEMMSEIAIQPYSSSATPTKVACKRSTFAVTMDYHGYDCAIFTPDQTPIAELAGYHVAVSVTTDDMNGNVPAGKAQKIVVTVSGPGNTPPFQLVSWRTEWSDAL